MEVCEGFGDELLAAEGDGDDAIETEEPAEGKSDAKADQGGPDELISGVREAAPQRRRGLTRVRKSLKNG